MNDKLGNERTPSLAELLQAAVSQAVGDMFVAMPAKIVTYTAATQMADVQPLLSRPVVFDDGTESLDKLPIIPGVPVAFPRGGGYFMSFPLAPGDLVLLVFCDRSIDKYKSSPGTTPVNPVDLRTNDISDAVAIPGFYPVLKALKGDVTQGAIFGAENDAQLRAKGATMEVTSKGLPASVGGYVAMSTLVDVLWAKLYAVIATAWVVAPTDGGAALKAAFIAAFPIPPSSTASKNLKAD